MAVRDTVRDVQRRVAALDGAYARAVTNFDRTCARRAEVLAKHDSLVALAQGEIERTIAAMAVEIGADLTATLLGLDAAHVRHLAKARKGGGTTNGADDGGPGPLSSRVSLECLPAIQNSSPPTR